MNTCPACKANLQDQPIPEEHRHCYVPGATHYSRTIGVEVSEVYDGVLYWQCPDCGHRWHRWEEGTSLYVKAKKYVDR